MSLEENLLEKIAVLAAPMQFDEDGRRILDRHESQTQVGSVLREISETVLARELRFEADENTLGLDVASGRVLRISTLEMSRVSDGVRGLVGTWLSEEDQATFLADAIRGLADTDAAITVVSTPLNKSDAPSHARGFSGARLDDLLTETVDEKVRATSFDSFAREAGDQCLSATVFEGGELIHRFGPEESSTKLAEFFLDNADALSGPSTADRFCQIFRTAEDKSLGILIARDGVKFFLGLCDAIEGVSICDSWGL